MTDRNTQSATRASALATDLARNLPLGDLLALGTHLRAERTPEALMQEVADAVHSVLGYPQVYVRLRHPDTDALDAVAFAGVAEQAIAALRQHPTAPAIYQGMLQAQYRLSESFLVPSTHVPDAALTSADTPQHGLLLIPLRGRAERLTGVIYVVPTDDVELLALPNVQWLEVIARQAALALDNARLAARTARLLAKEQLLAELGRDISTTLDLDAMLARTIVRLGAAFQRGAIALLNTRRELVVAAVLGEVDAAARAVRIAMGEGICGWVAQQGLSFLSNDVLNETRVKPIMPGVGSNRSIRSYIAVPLLTGGQVIGTLNVESPDVHAFTYEDVDLLEAVAAQISGPITSARLYQEAQRLTAQVARRNEHLTVLNAIARSAVSTLHLDRVLTNVIAQVQQGFGYDHVELYMVDEEQQLFILTAQAGRIDHLLPELRQPCDRGMLGRTLRLERSVRVDDVRLDAEYVGDVEHIRSELCVPIMSSGRVLAILNLEEQQVAAFTDEDVSALETAADVLASAIESARLYQKAQAAAVLEERSRLARDLHDSISQQLFSMTLTAQAARAQLEKNPARAAQQLERLQETAAAALGEMRALIFQLRPPGLSEQGLIGALQQHVVALSRREGLHVNLHVAGEERDARGVEQALYRIAQEALNNVVRHAGACTVEVQLAVTPAEILLRVADDGTGFDQTSIRSSSGRHLGLLSMRERAAELGGSLDIRSAPAAGTEIVVRVPGRAAREPLAFK